MLLSLFGTIAEISLSTSVLIAVLLLLSPLLKKNFSVKCLLIVWLILSVRLIIPYSIRFPAPFLQIPVAGQEQTAEPSANQGSAPGNGSEQFSPSPANGSPALPEGTSGTGISNSSKPVLSPDEIITVVWAAGAAIYMAVHLTGYIRLRRSLKRYAIPIGDRETMELFEHILEQMALTGRRVTLYIYPNIKGPMMTGFLRPAVLLPAGVRYNAAELEMILRHELVHYKKKDIWTKLFLTCVNAIHWFNPLIYLMTAEANKLIENACDSEIIRNTNLAQRKIYSESILSAISIDHSRQLGLSTYYHGGKKIMKQRLVNIFDGTVKKRGLPVILAVILAVGLSGTLVSCKANVEVGSDNTNSPAATDTASPEPSMIVDPEPKDLQAVSDMAEKWAEAVKNRDGKAQFDLMSKELQEQVREEFEGLNWVTGTSSPWVESYEVVSAEASSAAPEYATASVILNYATSTGPSGSYQQTLTFIEEDGALKINAISELVEVEAPTDTSSDAYVPTFDELIKLLGLTKDELLAAIPETSEPVDEGGLGFAKTGIRVWFDAETYTKVAQVLIMTENIDLNGVKVGDSFADFKTVFGEPISDNNGDAHFKYGDIYLSVVRDVATDKVIAVYILAEDF